MTRRAFGRFGAAGVAFSGSEFVYQITQVPQGFFPVFVNDDTLNLLLLLIRKGNDHIRNLSFHCSVNTM